jgi:multidrug efflux pump subunit AcrA (membrane-fusion protein)
MKVQRPRISPLPSPRRAPAFLSGSRGWIVGLSAVALVLAGLIARETVFPPQARAVAARLATVSRGSVTSTVTGTGSLVAGSQVNVGFRVSGQLTEIDVKVGDHVKTGQALARIDSSAQQAALSQAQAQLSSAQANLQSAQSPLTAAQIAQLQHALSAAQQSYNDTVAQVNAQNQADSATVAGDQAKLTADGCTAGSTTPPCPQDQSTLSADQSRQRLDQINGQGRINSAGAQVQSARDNYTVQTQAKPNAVASAQAAVVSAQAQVQAAQLALNETTLTAPSSGVIVSLNGEVGEMAPQGGGVTGQAPGTTAPQAATASSASAAASSAFAVISDNSQYYAVVPFAEADAAGLQPNQNASLTFDAIPGLTISGHLLMVAPSSTVTSNVINYYASFVLNRLDPRLRAGMTVNASVTTASADNVLYVPNAAIRNSNGTTTVTVLSNGQQVSTEVVVGLQGDTLTEIKAGLNEGQQVVLPTIRAATGSTGGGRGLLGGGGFGGGVVRGGGG